MCQMRRGSAEKTNGEKCQMASFGQSSRRPPPANPQPTANGSAPHSAGDERRHRRQRPDDGAGVGAGDQADEKRALERQVGGVVAQQDAGGDAGVSGMPERERQDPAIQEAAALEDQDVAEPADTAPASWPAAP